MTSNESGDTAPIALDQSRVLDGAAVGMAVVVVMALTQIFYPPFEMAVWMILVAVLLPAVTGFVVDIGRLQ